MGVGTETQLGSRNAGAASFQHNELRPHSDSPVGKYNPDWAVLKHDGQTIDLVRETKSTKDFLKLRTSEADKVRCGQKHLETLGVPFAVVVLADEV